MTREQAELIIKEEQLIYTDWYPSYKHVGEFHLAMWFDSKSNKFEVLYIGERGCVEREYAFDYEREAIDKMLQMNYWCKYYDNEIDLSGDERKEVALKIIKDEDLEVIWDNKPLKPLCAGIKHDKQRDKYISFITDSKAEVIEWRSVEFEGDRYSETFEEVFSDEDTALYALINRASVLE